MERYAIVDRHSGLMFLGFVRGFPAWGPATGEHRSWPTLAPAQWMADKIGRLMVELTGHPLFDPDVVVESTQEEAR